ncbi:myrcene synthase, chloroplastic-like [Heracleum sosnowskyi]|uniref:Myrcene synthase, chloroplastic-like n=1 Tax=Heracleum sosnowskyi TaxID=360622 RepID=A0AAD8IY62_9APIA|nr:myrcene synthase, chloroplastic-like [Heracleum sosnowskyi]
MALSIVNIGSGFSILLKPFSTFKKPFPSATKVVNTTSIRCTANDAAFTIDENLNVRRSGNYAPSTWDYDFFQSLNSDFKGEICSSHASDLKEEVRMLLNKEEMDSLDKVELVDSIQRLGVCYHFEDEIQRILEAICDCNEKWDDQDLYATSLKFRLLRQHNFNVPQEVFKDFMDESGKFKASLSKDMKGILYLYEASYHSTKDEKIMEEAQDFTKTLMKNYMTNISSEDDKLGELVSHALELPLHWREPRHEARWFIDFYETSSMVLEENMNSYSLLQFAKLDYNMVQSIYQDELKHLSRWWKRTEWGEKLTFARARLMECFYWSVGYNSRPEFGYARRVLTAVTAFITTIDDIYDVYATLEELEVLTKLTKRWDATELDQLPDYMKICFTEFYNEINEIADVAQRKHGVSVLPYLQKVWTDVFEAYLLEAQWYHIGYKPSLREYLDNAWISITGPVILTHSYFLTATSITDEALQCLKTYPYIIRLSATILRLADDLGTSSHEMERGDTPKSIQCYMNDTGVSEEEAREHIKYMISETWKELNEERLVVQSIFPKTFIDMCLNLARISLSVYLYGDGHGAPSSRDKERLMFLFVNSIPL